MGDLEGIVSHEVVKSKKNTALHVLPYVWNLVHNMYTYRNICTYA